jgi:valyl-tRNA synthetase
LETLRPILASLARLDGEALTLCATADSRPQAASVVVGDVVAQLPLAGLVDLAAERARLERALAELERRIAQTQARLGQRFRRQSPGSRGGTGTHALE